MHAACRDASDLCPWVKCLKNFELVWFHVWFWKSFQKIPSQPLICFKHELGGIWYSSFLVHSKPKRSKLKLQGRRPLTMTWINMQEVSSQAVLNFITLTFGCLKGTNCASSAPDSGNTYRKPWMFHCLTVPAMQIILWQLLLGILMLESEGLLMVTTTCKMKPYRECRGRSARAGNTPLLIFSPYRWWCWTAPPSLIGQLY